MQSATRLYSSLMSDTVDEFKAHLDARQRKRTSEDVQHDMSETNSNVVFVLMLSDRE